MFYLLANIGYTEVKRKNIDQKNQILGCSINTRFGNPELKLGVFTKSIAPMYGCLSVCNAKENTTEYISTKPRNELGNCGCTRTPVYRKRQGG